MKKNLLFLSIGLHSFLGAQNIGINTETPQALLDINPTSNPGILVPTVGIFPETLPTEDQNSMLIFLDKSISNAAGMEGFYYWDQDNQMWQYIFQSKMINNNLFETIAASDIKLIIPGNGGSVNNTNVWFTNIFNKIEAPDANFYIDNGELIIGRTGNYSIYFTGAVYKKDESTTATETQIGIFIDGDTTPIMVSAAPLPAADNGPRSVNHTISGILSLTKGQRIQVKTRRTASITTEMGTDSPYTLTLTYLD